MEARSWARPPAPRLAPPDAFLHRRLRLSDAWLTEPGEWRSLRDAETAELWTILGYLRWHAPALMARDPEAAAFADADRYLASRPLVAAIDAELSSRGESPPGEALLLIRSLGFAPWELAGRGRRVADGAVPRG